MNTSGHKFGLTTPGLGWVLWRDESLLADELRFKLKYLGGVEETFGLNFSRPGFQVVHQYFNFVSLGHSGYRTQFQNSLFVARAFSFELLNSSKLPGCFEIVSSIHESIENDSALSQLKTIGNTPGLQTGCTAGSLQIVQEIPRRISRSATSNPFLFVER